MDHMLNQRRVSLEQEFERKRAENLKACHADFRSKTDVGMPFEYPQVSIPGSAH
jgi:hypothetical protein